MSARLLCVLALVCGLLAPQAAPGQTLTGILCEGTNKAALIERQGWPPSILKEGEREREEGNAAGFEVLRIMPESASVELKTGMLTNTLTLDMTPAELAKKPVLALKSARLTSALELYQQLAERTVLRPPTLPDSKIDLVVAGGATRAEIIQALRAAVFEQKVMLQDFGDKFAVATTPAQANLLAAIPPPPKPAPLDPNKPAGNEETLAAGTIRFQSADVAVALEVYAELLQRTILRPVPLPDAKLTFHSQTPCRRDEAVWMFETALRLAGLAVEKHGDKFVFVGPPQLAAQVPKFPPDAAKGEAKCTARIALANPIAPPPPPRPLGEAPVKNPLPISHHLQLLKLYSEITGREPLLVPPELVGIRVTLKTQAPLTAGEMTYALEAVAALNGFKFEKVGDKQVQIIVPNQKGGGKPVVF